MMDWNRFVLENALRAIGVTILMAVFRSMCIYCGISRRREEQEEVEEVTEVKGVEKVKEVKEVINTKLLQLKGIKTYTQDTLIIGKRIGGGKFSAVYIATRIFDSKIFALKILKEEYIMQNLTSIESEVRLQSSLKHKNILAVIGVYHSSVGKGLIFPLLANGDLQNYVISNQGLTYTTKLKFMLQISQALKYLVKSRIVHRDVATRNVLVGAGDADSIKLADFGLAKRWLPGTNYYRVSDESADRAICHMAQTAPEALRTNTYNEKSDVWSFGVLCWQIVHNGQTPYADIVEPLRYLKEGGRLKFAAWCAPELERIALDCWRDSPDDRPTFTELSEQLLQLPTHSESTINPIEYVFHS